MRLNHINIPVDDVAASRLFFEQHFNFTCIETKGNGALAVMKGADDFTLVLMSQVFNQSEIHEFPSAFHIGFLLGTREDVGNQYDRLKMGGVHLEREPAGMRGVFGFYFKAPGNILIEVSTVENPL